MHNCHDAPCQGASWWRASLARKELLPSRSKVVPCNSNLMKRPWYTLRCKDERHVEQGKKHVSDFSAVHFFAQQLRQLEARECCVSIEQASRFTGQKPPGDCCMCLSTHTILNRSQVEIDAFGHVLPSWSQAYEITCRSRNEDGDIHVE